MPSRELKLAKLVKVLINPYIYLGDYCKERAKNTLKLLVGNSLVDMVEDIVDDIVKEEEEIVNGD